MQTHLRRKPVEATLWVRAPEVERLQLIHSLRFHQPLGGDAAVRALQEKDLARGDDAPVRQQVLVGQVAVLNCMQQVLIKSAQDPRA